MSEASLAANPSVDVDTEAMSERLIGLLLEPPNRPQRLLLALTVALVIHILIILGIQFNRWMQPAKQPAYSLNVSLIEQVGGDLYAAPGGLEQTPPTTAQQPLDPRASDAQTVDESQISSISPSAQAVPTGEQQPETAPVFTTTELRDAERADAPISEQTLESATDPLAMLSGSDTDLSPRAASENPHNSSLLEGFYAESWRIAVEQAAANHLPEQVRNGQLAGRVTLDVAISADGNVEGIKLLRSSGNEDLDRAARAIVYLAAPFEPFPPALRRTRDVIHIIRTWEFDSRSSLRASNR